MEEVREGNRREGLPQSGLPLAWMAVAVMCLSAWTALFGAAGGDQTAPAQAGPVAGGSSAGGGAGGRPATVEALLMDFATEQPGASTGTVVEVTDEHATVGKAVKVTFPAGAFGWIDCWTPKLRDWSGYESLALDVFNPAQDMVSLGVTIRDATGTGAYDDRFNGTVQLRPGANAVKIPLATMATPGGRRRLDLRSIKSWGFSADKKTVLYFSYLRLEGEKVAGLEILPLVDCNAGQTPNDASIKVFLTDEHLHPGVDLGLKCVIAAGPPGSRPGQALWVGGFGTEGVPTRSWQAYDYLRFHAYQEGPDPMALALRLRDGEGRTAVVPLTIAAGKDVDCEVDLRSVKDINLGDISQWGLAFSQSYPKPLYLSYIRLVKGDESQKRYAPKPKAAEALAALRKDAEGARDELVARIEQARRSGIDTAYDEIYPVIAEVALDYRWFLPACQAEREGYARFVAERCRRAAQELEEALAGTRQTLAVPPPPEVSRLKAVGRYFQDGDRPRLIVSAQDGVPGGNTLFTGPKFFVGSAAGSGGSRWDVRSAPIWQVYEQFPETHRVGWTGWCGHYICDASSAGGQGETVVICIESPLTRTAISEYIHGKVAPVLAAQRDVPIHAINWEAAYVCYCDRTRGMFRQFLTQRYGQVDALNRVWGTNYRSFEEVELPHHDTMAEARAGWFDFADFNCRRFADHYGWVRKELDAVDPRQDRLLIGGGPGYAFHGSTGVCGVDVEMMHEELDKGAILNESGGRFYVTDLLRSIAGPEEMVADVEFHGSRPPLVLGHLLHGDAAIDWCEWLTTSSGYAGLRAIPFNPKFSLKEVELFLRQILDARRLEREIMAFAGAPREVALLYSRTSLLQVPPEFLQADRNPYGAEVINAYAGAQAVGVPLRFLTEKQLVSGQLGETKVLLVPGACYLPKEVNEALLKFVEGGGWVVVTPQSLFFDQYNRPADYLSKLGISVSAMQDGSRKRRVTVDLSREDGFLQGEVEEVQHSDEPRAPIRLSPEGPFAHSALTLQGAGVLQELVLSSPARAVANFVDGKPAIALVERGKGRLYYLATPLEPASMTALLDRLLPAAGVSRPVTARLKDGSLASDFEFRAVPDGSRWLVYLMNLGEQPRTVTLSGEFDIASVRNLTFGTVAYPVGPAASPGSPAPPILEVPAKDVWLLELQPKAP